MYLKENRLLAKGKKLVKTDFATMYTSLKLDKTQRNIEEVVRRCFKIMQGQNETYTRVSPVEDAMLAHNGVRQGTLRTKWWSSRS